MAGNANGGLHAEVCVAMPDLLLELFSEEIPARMQQQAARDLERLVVGALTDRGLLFEGAKAFSGPRRLTLAIKGLPRKQPDVRARQCDRSVQKVRRMHRHKRQYFRLQHCIGDAAQ